MVRSWILACLALTCGVIVAVTQQLPWIGVIEFVVFAALAWLMSPLVFPRSLPAAPAHQPSSENGRPIVYWRPGCQYCLRLRLRLGRSARQAHWVNIWRDPDGAAAVRAATGGDETVPTVVVDGKAYVNPAPGWVRQRLAR
ncbi:glutaredoxin domain-containing protein [Micromonospora mangrovi]|uniref:Glutaredoxin domain-containing protein n=2 Tax=Micromonospora TaxID=1873 RepID=A0AAU8HH02_9ACTN